MSNTRRWKLLCGLLAAVLCLMVLVFAVSAETLTTGAEDGAATEPEEGVLTTGAEDGNAPVDSAEATGTTGTTDESGTGEASTTGETSAATETSEAEQTSASNVPWKLIISVGVIILVAAVLFILAKTKTKLGEKIAKFFKDYKSELKKIVWMPWKDLLKATGIVLVVLLAAALLIGLLDYGFSSLIRLLSSIGK